MQMAKARDIPGLDWSMSYGDAAARTVAVRAQEVYDHAAGVLDTEDIERVHAMRVATRRLRAVLEIYEPCFPREELRPVLREVRALADALGERRDPDVELQALGQFAASVGPDERAGVELFIARTRAEQADGNMRLREALEDADRAGLRERLERLSGHATTERAA
jgi:CHAD domain-containing protein